MTQTWLVPIDGSDTALRSIDWITANAAEWRTSPHIHLINVQAALPSHVGRFIDTDTLRQFHFDTGMAALGTARDRLATAGIKAELHVLVGEAATTITTFADSHGCTQIVIGTHGHSGLTGTLLGSVAMKVVHRAHVPVLLMR